MSYEAKTIVNQMSEGILKKGHKKNTICNATSMISLMYTTSTNDATGNIIVDDWLRLKHFVTANSSWFMLENVTFDV